MISPAKPADLGKRLARLGDSAVVELISRGQHLGPAPVPFDLIDRHAMLEGDLLHDAGKRRAPLQPIAAGAIAVDDALNLCQAAAVHHVHGVGL